jgi:hypothetical protein
MWIAMIKFIAMFIPRISVAVLTICGLIVFSVLTFTTPPATLRSKQNGQTVFVVGYVQNSIAGHSAYSLASFGMRDSIYVLAAAHAPPIQFASFVAVQGKKSTTDAGGAVIVEESRWTLPTTLANLPATLTTPRFAGSLPFLRNIPWITTAIVGVLTVAIIFWTVRFGRVLAFVLLSLVTSFTISNALTGWNLIIPNSRSYLIALAATFALVVYSARGTFKTQR